MQAQKSVRRAPYLSETLLKYGFLAILGGVGYYTIEVFYRGYSHISMAICGAVCMCAIYNINDPKRKMPFPMRILLGTVIITAVEFIAGCILNLWLGLRVWDYSNLPYNLFGQICLGFIILWMLLNVPLSLLCYAIRKNIFGE